MKTYFVRKEYYISHLLVQIWLTIIGSVILFENTEGVPQSTSYSLPIGYVLLFIVAGLRTLGLQPRCGETIRPEFVFSLAKSAHLTVNFALFRANFVWAMLNGLS